MAWGRALVEGLAVVLARASASWSRGWSRPWHRASRVCRTGRGSCREKGLPSWGWLV